MLFRSGFYIGFSLFQLWVFDLLAGKGNGFFTGFLFYFGGYLAADFNDFGHWLQHGLSRYGFTAERKVKVLRAQNASVSLDGRILDRHFPLEITIQPEAITLIIPN